jgi:hypothetical protein
MDTEERDYLWGHFAFNAEQRLKAFNFFVVFSVFANGGVFAAVEKASHGAVFVLIGGFIVVLSLVFAVIDVRSQSLLKLAVPGLKEYEQQFAEHSRLFARDAERHSGVLRYTVAFRVLFAMQFSFGAGTVVYGVVKWA